MTLAAFRGLSWVADGVVVVEKLDARRGACAPRFVIASKIGLEFVRTFW